MLEEAAGASSGSGSQAKTSSKMISNTAAETPADRVHRFVAGTVLDSRFRIVNQLGKGGMGEVYRAEDLKLGQQVALKFLPEQLAQDGAGLARLYREVNVARQISHPNVCRVFDIGETGTDHFLSMEYVDGEDLASLLRRIGRLPTDKAADIARQLCAGIAAAHENDVLHRDIKPANIMIDGRGRVRITDFGLAAATDEIRFLEPAGTREYMAPEQFGNDELSLKTDVYALGLVLYEIFTGKRAFEPEGGKQISRRQQRRPPVPPSALVKDIDPTLERVILRCLEKDPQSRPTIRQIAAALGGGDPLAAAVAAGEIPSPEMLAASPLEGALRASVGAAYLALTLASIALMVFLSGRGLLHGYVPLKQPPEVLASNAASCAENLGYRVSAADHAHGFISDDGYLDYLGRTDRSPTRWERLRTGYPAALRFWYRQSPYPLIPRSRRYVSRDDPELDSPGMFTVVLDTTGRMLEFEGIPPSETPAGQGTPDWAALFEWAGLDMSGFERVKPLFVARSASTERAAWNGSLPGSPGMTLHVEAAAFKGVPVFFKIVWPWADPVAREYRTPPDGRAGYQQGAGSRQFFLFSFATYLLATVTCIMIARRNLRAGRGDRRGALKLAIYLFVTQMLAWFFQSHHVRSAGEIDLFYSAIAWALFYSGELWLLYIALEPYVRQRWPYNLISWSRLLAGNIRDPSVGRDILLGAVFGAASTLLAAYSYLAFMLLGSAPDKPPAVGLGGLGGVGGAIAQMLAMQKEVLSDPMYALVVLLLASILLRRDRPAIVVTWIVFTLGGGLLVGAQFLPSWCAAALVVGGYIAVLTRIGLLSAITFQLYNFTLLNFQLTSDFSAWYAGSTVIALLMMVSLAYYGYRISTSRRAVATPVSGPV
jgi:serine/threonine-protein kinase